MDFNVPLFDLSYNNRKIRDHIIAVVERHIETSTFILGPDVELFENKFSKLINCKYSIGVNSGTDALILALKALDIEPGSDVIVSPTTNPGGIMPVAVQDIQLVIPDSDPNSFNISPKEFEKAIQKGELEVIKNLGYSTIGTIVQKLTTELDLKSGQFVPFS